MVKKQVIIVILAFLLVLNIANARQTIISQGNDLRIDLIRIDPSPISPGENADVWFEISNLKETSLVGVKIELVAPFPFSAINNAIIFDKLDAGKSLQFKFTISTNKDAKEGDYKLNVQYFAPGLDAITSSTFSVSIIKTGKILTPTSVSIEPKEISPGSDGLVKIIFKNTADSRLKDIVIKLDLRNESIPIAPLTSTAEKKIKSLGVNGEETVYFNIIVSPNAEAKVYKVPLKITYYDDLGSLYTSDDTIGIAVNSESQFQLNIENSNIYNSGERGKVTVSVSNVAPLDAKFVNLELLDSKYYQVISQKSIYIGDLESDDFDTVEYDIYAKKTKDWKVPLDFLVRYKDAYNNELEYKKTLYLETYSYFGQLKYGIKSPKGIFRFIIFVAIIVFLYYFYVNWSKTKSIKNGLILTLQGAANLGERIVHRVKRIFR